MPFAQQYKEVYDQVYKPVCDDNAFQCWRVDEVAGPGSITKDIINGIIDADLIIADLTTKNANVFYELGIAHAIGNKTIMTAQSTKDIPFDIGNYRVLVYEQSITGAKRLYSHLDAAIKELIKTFEQTNNPVQEVLSSRGALKLTRKVLLIEALNMKFLRKRFRDFVAKEPIVYVEDLRRIDLKAVQAKYKLGPTILGELAAIMLKLNVVDDLNKFHNTVLALNINVEASEFVFQSAYR